MIRTSADSPRARRDGIACGVFPIEGPLIITIVLPVACLNAGERSRSAAENPPRDHDVDLGRAGRSGNARKKHEDGACRQQAAYDNVRLMVPAPVCGKRSA